MTAFAWSLRRSKTIGVVGRARYEGLGGERVARG